MNIRLCRQKGGAGAYSGLRFGTVSGRLAEAGTRSCCDMAHCVKTQSEDSRTKRACLNKTQKRLSRISAFSTMLTAAAVIQIPQNVAGFYFF